MLETLFTLGWKGDFNKLRKNAQTSHCLFSRVLYELFVKKHQSYIPLSCTINGDLRFIHFTGIHISSYAIIGAGCTLYQHVTIGSNHLKKTKHPGDPQIGNNVLIGAGARIIGGIKIGNNVKIGAGCVVMEDVPDNSVVVMNKPRIIIKSEECQN